MSASLLWEVLFSIWLFSEIFVALGMRTRNSGGNTRDRGTQLLLWIVIFFSIFACESIGESHAPTMFGGAHWLKIVAILVFILGLAIRWTAIISLENPSAPMLPFAPPRPSIATAYIAGSATPPTSACC